MTNKAANVPYQSDASLNAAFLLQKEAFLSQTNCLSDLLSNMQHSNTKVLADVKIPQLLSTRTLSEDYAFGNRHLENEEVAVLGFLDESGKISVSSRLNEFMLFMTRVTKAEHRALCIHIISSKTSDQCKKDFTKFGGLRIVKRWLKVAEESDYITEMTALVKLCNKLPFDEVAIREIGIGKVIRKLLKFQSPSGSDVGGLRVQVEALMANWRAKQQELASGVAAKAPETVESPWSLPSGELVKALSDRLVQQRGLPSQQNEQANSADQALANGEMDKNESKEEDNGARKPIKSIFPNAHLLDQIDTAMEVDGASPSEYNHSFQNKHFSIASFPSNKSQAAENVLEQIKPISAAVSAPKPVSVLSSLRAAAQSAAQSPVESGDGMMHGSKGALGVGVGVDDTLPQTPPVLVIRPPVARERKPLDMAEKARTMLAMRAQQALSLSNHSAAQGEPSSPTGSAVGYGETGPPLSPSTSNVLSILSAVGKARVASGLQTVEQAVPLRGALKKPTEDGAKKVKKVIHWADENGGLLREVRTIEVAKIKRSTAHYSSTRELSKRERLAEKETHLSKAEDAMQKNTEWRTPVPLSLSIVVLDNISIVADSAEKVAQEKRLAHVLEVRYALDTQIPADPDESPSVHEPSSSSAHAATMEGTAAGDDAAPAIIPWYAPGTEPPPEEVAAPAATAADILRTSRNGYLDDNALAELMPKLPYSLQTLERYTLRSLLQDPETLQSILRHDNTVDETNLAAYQRNLYAETNTRDRMTRFGGYESTGGADVEGVRRSRWAVDAVGPPGGFPPSQPYNFDYDYGDSYAPPRPSGVSYADYDRPPATWNNPGYDGPPAGRGSSLSVLEMRDRRHVAPQGRFPTTKAATPCRFFNTAKGCQFGDKCSFGHFLPNDAPQRAVPLKADAYTPDVIDVERDSGHSRWGGGGGRGGAMNGPGMRRFGEAPRQQLSGPGSRLHSQTLPSPVVAAAAPTEVVDLTNGGQPAKRAKTRFS